MSVERRWPLLVVGVVLTVTACIVVVRDMPVALAIVVAWLAGLSCGVAVAAVKRGRR